MSFKVRFEPSGRGKAQCPPNPDYPEGIDLRIAGPGVPSCTITFPYPAPECGVWVATCDECGLKYGATAAGRPDDPRTMTIPCQYRAKQN